MSNDADVVDDHVQYFVVRNHEEQYSIWRVDRPIPGGWDPVGEAGSRTTCLDRINELWTDMRPLSLRRAMERDAELPTVGR